MAKILHWFLISAGIPEVQVSQQEKEKQRILHQQSKMWYHEKDELVDLLPFPTQVQEKLHKKGFTTYADFETVQTNMLSNECQISRKQALEILEYVKYGTVPVYLQKYDSSSQTGGEITPVEMKNCFFKTITASDLLKYEKSKPVGIKINDDFDKLFGGGGLPFGCITEIYGHPGSGRTQLCFHLSVAVQTPAVFHQPDNYYPGSTIFIDLDGDFSVRRMKQISANYTALIKKAARKLPQYAPYVDWNTEGEEPPEELENLLQNQPIPENVHKISTRSIRKNIYYFRIDDQIKFLAFSNNLSSIIAGLNQIGLPVKLLIVDSIAGLFKYDVFSRGYQRNAVILDSIGKKLKFLAQKHNLAVVITNQIVNKSTDQGMSMPGAQQMQESFVPALGSAWANIADHRIKLEMSTNEGEWTAEMEKSVQYPPSCQKFTITETGISVVGGGGGLGKTDHDENDESTTSQSVQNEESNKTANTKKRKREDDQ